MYEAVNDPTKELLAEDTLVEPDKSLIEFSTSAVAVMEDVGTVRVMIERSGLVHTEATIKVLFSILTILNQIREVTFSESIVNIIVIFQLHI